MYRSPKGRESDAVLIIEKDVLKFLSPEDRTRLLADAVRLEYPPAAVILESGSREEALFLVRRGIVSIQRPYGGVFVEIAELSVGDTFGEMSLLENIPATAQVLAIDEVEVDRVARASVDSVLASDAEFRAHFYRSMAVILSRRLRHISSYLPVFLPKS